LKGLSAYVKSQGGALIATGHSLGGGLATAASSTGFIDRAVVFNPAGLHLLTASKLDGSIEKAARVTKAYVSDIDVLNLAQEIIASPFTSTRGEVVYVENGGLHFIDGLKRAFSEE
jgi:filamentous hemagglutinin